MNNLTLKLTVTAIQYVAAPLTAVIVSSVVFKSWERRQPELVNPSTPEYIITQH